MRGTTAKELAFGWQALLDDAEMVLAKADLGIAARYVELADDGEEIFARIREEFERTVELTWPRSTGSLKV